MKKSALLLFVAAVLLSFAAIFFLFHWQNFSEKKSYIIDEIYKIVIRDNKSGSEFSLQKSRKSGEWEIAWANNVWSANGSAIEHFFKKIQSSQISTQRDIDSKGTPLSIIITAKSGERETSLSDKEAVSLFGDIFFKKPNATAYEELFYNFLNKNVFNRIRDDCQVLRIKRQNAEFTFSKLNGKWFFDTPESKLGIENRLIMQFFHHLFALEASDVVLHGEKIIQSNVSITLYNGNSGEKVKFLDIGDGTCLAENTDVNLLFNIKKDALSKVENAIESLLNFKIFLLESCDDLNVFLPASGERFTFHNLKNQNKWQFTYSKDGELKVKEIQDENAASIFDFLKDTESICVLLDLPVEEKIFTIVINEFSDSSKAFNFYKYNDRLFVEPDSKNIKFEIKSSFVPIFFHIIRANLIEQEGIVL